MSPFLPLFVHVFLYLCSIRYQTVLYLHLRANHTSEGYSREALEQDLEQTKDDWVQHDDAQVELWSDEPAAPTTAIAKQAARNIEMTTYARVKYQGTARASLPSIRKNENGSSPKEDPLRMPPPPIV